MLIYWYHLFQFGNVYVMEKIVVSVGTNYCYYYIQPTKCVPLLGENQRCAMNVQHNADH